MATHIRGILTVSSVISVLSPLLLAFFLWASRDWIAHVNEQLAEAQKLEVRVSTLEATVSISLKSIDRRLDSIDANLDRLVTERRNAGIPH